MQSIRVEISLKTVAFLLLLGLVYFVGSRVVDVIIQLMLAFVLMTALHPAVTRLQSLRISRFIAVFWIYILIIGSIVLSLFIVVPPLIEQTISLINQFDLPHLPIIDELKNLQFSFTEITNLWNQYGTSVSGLIAFATSTFSVVFSFMTVLVMTFYFLLEREHLYRYTQFVFQQGDPEERGKVLINKVERALGTWVRGEALLMITIGLMTFVGLTLMKVPYALPLAILAGLLEALPNIGPTISAVPAVLVSLVTVSPFLALLTALLYWAIQALENNFIVPFVMKTTVGINPLTSIVLILVGFHFGGVIGALLVIPYYIVTRVVVKELSPEIAAIKKN